MDRDTVVRLAREAGGNLSYLGWTTRFMGVRFEPDSLDRFATLIANETLERAAKVCETSDHYPETSDRYRDDYLADKIRALKE